MAWERLVFNADADTGTEAKELNQTVGHLDPKRSEASQLCLPLPFLADCAFCFRPWFRAGVAIANGQFWTGNLPFKSLAEGGAEVAGAGIWRL